VLETQAIVERRQVRPDRRGTAEFGDGVIESGLELVVSEEESRPNYCGLGPHLVHQRRILLAGSKGRSGLIHGSDIDGVRLARRIVRRRAWLLAMPRIRVLRRENEPAARDALPLALVVVELRSPLRSRVPGRELRDRFNGVLQEIGVVPDDLVRSV